MYVALVSAVVVVLDISHVACSTLEYAGWAVAMHLWFLAVYLVVVSLTPIAIAAQRRWGLLRARGAGSGRGRGRRCRLCRPVPYLGLLNYVFCWAALYQLGIAWQKGLLAGARPVLLAAGSAGALALLLWLGPYPVSMIGVPGQAVQNTDPPSLAMLAFGCAQAGLVISVAPALNRALRGHAVQRVLARANSNVMALYLWHMIPVVIVAIVGYPAGLLPQPVEGTAEWWLAAVGMGARPQPGDSGRAGAVVVGPKHFRGAAALAECAAGSLGRVRSCWRAPRWRRRWPGLCRCGRLRPIRTLSLAGRGDIRGVLWALLATGPRWHSAWQWFGATALRGSARVRPMR